MGSEDFTAAGIRSTKPSYRNRRRTSKKLNTKPLWLPVTKSRILLGWQFCASKFTSNEKEIHREFSTVGNVCRIIQNFQRVFIRFREKEEAERAIMKFGRTYEVVMAKNNKNSVPPPEVGNNSTKADCNPPPCAPLAENPKSAVVSEKLNPGQELFHLILGNLPKNYTVKDVNALVEEARPICIENMDETRVFNVRFCHIVVDSFENLTYLIDKLNGFVICGEKLIAAEAKNLLEWRERAV